MLITVNAAKCVGIEAMPITIEINITSGIGIHLVGLGDIAVKESLLRVTTAMGSLGYHVPGKKIVINLAPADTQKKGTGYDLPIATGIIFASKGKCPEALREYLIMGELGLDGSIRPVSGALPMVSLAMQQGLKGCILPRENAMESIQMQSSGNIYGVSSLSEVVAILSGESDCNHLLSSSLGSQTMEEIPFERRPYMDFSEIIGQSVAKRGMEIAAAGAHNVLLIGPPGAGKSSLAKALAGILPPMSDEESLVTSKIYSVAGLLQSSSSLIRTRPFRSPHYSISLPALIGGGSDRVVPGEISLAHNGVLFMDEFCELPKKVIDSLRAPLEDGNVVISRLKTRVIYPAAFTLVAATNPCPCGWWGEAGRCTCTPSRREAYLGRLSGPVLDRIDVQLHLRTVDPRLLLRPPKSETSAQVAERVVAAREIQSRRYQGLGISTNSLMNSELLDRFCALNSESQDFLTEVMLRKGLSARACSRIRKISRTIADLAGSSTVELPHLREAVSYRILDSNAFR